MSLHISHPSGYRARYYKTFGGPGTKNRWVWYAEYYRPDGQEAFAFEELMPLSKRAKEEGLARLALKTLAKRRWRPGEVKNWPKCWYKPVESFEEAEIATRFTLSMPVTAGVSPGHFELFRWMCDAAEKLGPPGRGGRAVACGGSRAASRRR